MDHLPPDRPSSRPRRADDAADPARATLTYVFDAHCPWCHAVTPTIAAVADLRPDVRVDVVHGRLLPSPRPLGAIEWYAPTAASVRGLTAAPFGPGFDEALSDGSVVGDSDTSAAAFVAMRSVAPDLALDIAAAMHAALFVDGRSLTDLDTVLDISTSLGLSPDRVMTMLANPLVSRLVAAERARVGASGLTGVPAVTVTASGQETTIATRLRSVEQVLGAIEETVGRRHASDV